MLPALLVRKVTPEKDIGENKIRLIIYSEAVSLHEWLAYSVPFRKFSNSPFPLEFAPHYQVGAWGFMSEAPQGSAWLAKYKKSMLYLLFLSQKDWNISTPNIKGNQNTVGLNTGIEIMLNNLIEYFVRTVRTGC